MDYLQLLGWLGNVCFVYGAYLLMEKKPRRYAVWNLFGNLAYIVQGVYYENWSLVALSLVLGTLSAAILLKWKKQDASSESI